MELNKLPLVLAATGLLFTSCQKDETAPETQELLNNEAPSSSQIPKEVIEKVNNLHFNSDYIETFELTLPGGATETTYLIENDIAMSADQLDKLSTADITSKQYRTYNLVSSPRTINVIGYTGTGYGQNLSNKMQQALQRAVANYNDLSIGLTFNLSFGTNYSSSDIVVYKTSNGQAGGVAGFPSGGNPYKFVQIFSGMESYSTSTNEHVITHEIGHTLGLRHTDWFSRQSCGQSGESANPDGAVHIPGTETGYDANSVMLACFSANESGNFGGDDEKALEYLY
ncbi:M57 family metalloprotease [Zunongwangia endophytica]|uniref:M57 family metalloprotease n=1 Tax=Zunongwangia endophytica TaxID=1808945 RepID=A0ABV8HC11_9FLAO|nr:M57 family metalloprotease [Zunongwangia endophytica]MDN3593312.1 M57 family metalloprotease [Zunongwangia endophytica]MDN3596932.1 M57 family metalloprotease [Zunongwangia endophytica]